MIVVTHEMGSRREVADQLVFHGRRGDRREQPAAGGSAEQPLQLTAPRHSCRR